MGKTVVKPWDVFISHASEDKATAALPLSDALRGLGARVWLDKFEIKIGDSIREKIDHGLANSRYGIVILSPDFLRKKWTKAELDGLFARDVVLPVWHQVKFEDVVQVSPMLAGRLAADLENGADHVAEQVIKILFSAGDNDVSSQSIAFEFAQAVSTGSISDIFDFMASNRALTLNALGVSGDDFYREDVRLGEQDVHFCAGTYQPSTGRYDDWVTVVLGNPSSKLVLQDGTEAEDIKSLIDRTEKARAWVGSNLENARVILPDIKPSFKTILVAGRRPQSGSSTSRLLGELNDCLFGCTVRTYDWLIDMSIDTTT